LERCNTKTPEVQYDLEQKLVNLINTVEKLRNEELSMKNEELSMKNEELWLKLIL